MKITNFRDYKIVGTNILDKIEYATVDVTSGIWFWKTTVPLRVSKKYYGSYWQFTDTGKFTPGFVLEELYDSYMAREQDA